MLLHPYESTTGDTPGEVASGQGKAIDRATIHKAIHKQSVSKAEGTFPRPYSASVFQDVQLQALACSGDTMAIGPIATLTV
jgi:hypothetical protein